MFSNALYFLLTTVFNLLSFALLLRFFLQWFRAPFQNPLAQMSMALTDFMVKPARRWIPSWKKKDLSTLVLALCVQALLLLLIKQFSFAQTNAISWLNLGLLAIVKVIKLSMDLFFYALFLQAILSWINPMTPIAGALDALTRPILAPIRKFLPTMSGIDFSALVAMILLQMLNTSFITQIEIHLNSIF